MPVWPKNPVRTLRIASRNRNALLAKGIAIIGLAVLTGCASTTPPTAQHASRLIRDNQLAKVQSDPLGAYLASKEFSNPYANTPLPSSPDPSAHKTLANAALSQLGIKYKYGGDAPDTGFDCSGLVLYAAEKSLGLKLPRRSRDMARVGQSVQRNELKKGDLVFFNTLGSRFSHVGIYLGDHKFVHAPRSGAVVRVENMNTRYWAKRYNGARRLDVLTASLN